MAWKEWAEWQNIFWVASRILIVNALPGAVPLVGEPCVPRYQGPLECLSREAGQPMSPSTPLCFSQSCAVFVSGILLGIWNFVWEM